MINIIIVVITNNNIVIVIILGQYLILNKNPVNIILII